MDKEVPELVTATNIATARAQVSPAAKTVPCLARQPIATADERVMGYELLFRESADENRFTAGGDAATATAIDTLNVLGVDVVCDGRLAFLNCTQQMLLKGYAALLPPDRIVVEIQPNVPADEDTVEACQRLKAAKYTIALDNFVPFDPREALIPYADIIKIDIRKVPFDESAALVEQYGSPQCRMLALKVQTRKEFLEAKKIGFTLFQGFFLSRPERMQARRIPGNQATCLRLLEAISKPELDFTEIEELIKHEPALCYRLLRHVSSPLLGPSRPVVSVRHALDLLGEREPVGWLRMTTSLIMEQNQCSDLFLSSSVRGRFCELIASKLNHDKSDLFLLGMLSGMDALLELPIGVVIEGLALDPDTEAELLRTKSSDETLLSSIRALVLARETGDWGQVTAQGKKLNLSLPFINRTYNEATTWAQQLA